VIAILKNLFLSFLAFECPKKSDQQIDFVIIEVRQSDWSIYLLRASSSSSTIMQVSSFIPNQVLKEQNTHLHFPKFLTHVYWGITILIVFLYLAIQSLQPYLF